MKYRCADCGSENVLQQISFMVNPNTYAGETLDTNDALWEDYYHCTDCDGESVEEFEDE